MTRRCSLSGRKIQTGNNVPNSNHRTRRIFAPNLQKVTVKSDLLNKSFKIKLSTRVIRTITKYGSLDEYLLHTKVQNMTNFGAQLKRQLKKLPSVTERLKAEAMAKKSKRIIRPSARCLKAQTIVR